MIIRCWGSRGSVPVSGKDFMKYGGDTTCIEIRTDDDKIIIIDAGSGIRDLGNQLLMEKRSKFHLLFTHFHWDHLIGFPYFKPIYMPNMEINVYGSGFEHASLEEMLTTIMTGPYHPVRFEDITVKFEYMDVLNRTFKISNLEITSIPVSHPNSGLGYKFNDGKNTFIFLTDNELTYKHKGGLDFDDYVEFCKDADVLFHDAEYTDKNYEMSKTWGHSRYKDAVQLALDSNVKMFGLIHHNQERTDDELDAIIAECNAIAKKAGSGLICFGVFQGMEVKL